MKITNREEVPIVNHFAIRVNEKQYNVLLPYDSLLKWLLKNGYPIFFEANIQSIIQLMKSDKKSQNKHVQMVLLHEVTKLVIEELNDDMLKTYLQLFKKELDTL